MKKLRKGDARWSTSKIILGWLLDTIQKTISLPEHRAARLLEILDAVPPTQRSIATKAWHKILGELRSMSIAIPGCAGLFLVLQEAFCHKEHDRPRLRLSKTLHGFLQDFRWLAGDLASRPTCIAELIPDRLPHTEGACDAAGIGMGGVHFVPLRDGSEVPLLWRSPFPQWVRDRLVSFSNPSGDINNSDLELAGSIAHNDILAQTADITEKTTHNCYDNTAAVYWQRKGAATTLGPAAFLLRLQAFHQRFFRYVPLRDYIPGCQNVMADFLSRRWDLSDAALLAHFNAHFPQRRCWRICHLRREMSSALTLALSRRRCDPALLHHIPNGRMDIGGFGPTSVAKFPSTPTLGTSWIRSPTSKFSELDTAMGVLPPAVGASSLRRFLTPSDWWDRGTPAWGPLPHV